ncbi:MAG: exodeoxyribonuclease VII large subunit [Oscillospiraceae bacterium]|nr:exodeoxyribonuclease VII large subunit [Oscillospiraceae bacterium]
MNSILSVSALNTYISFKLKNDPKLKGIAVKGEISDISINHTSGHIFFTLTDGSSNIRAVMFSQNASRLSFYPETGQVVIAFGGVDVYERNGVYQLNCTQLVPDGKGTEYIALAQLKEQLAKEGVFSKPKKSLPQYPSKVAVVTSPSGAAIHDVMSTVARRYPLAEVKLFPTTVQGLEAPASISNALSLADKSESDVIILTRGGGSDDDLSCFNTKAVVMAVYACKTPVVSAIGHEVDLTLSDLVADVRAATPTAAAELCTPDMSAISSEISRLKQEITRLTDRKLYALSNAVSSYKSIIGALSPENKLMRTEYQLGTMQESMKTSISHRLRLYEAQISGCINTLSAADPMNILGKGYALIYKDSHLVTESSGLSGKIQIVMKDGQAEAKVLQENEEQI